MIARYAPALVVAAWAASLASGIDGDLLTVLAMVALSFAVGAHIHQELK